MLAAQESGFAFVILFVLFGGKRFFVVVVWVFGLVWFGSFETDSLCRSVSQNSSCLPLWSAGTNKCAPQGQAFGFNFLLVH